MNQGTSSCYIYSVHVSTHARGVRESLWDSFSRPVGGAALQALHWAGSKHLHLLSISQASGRFSNLCVGTGGRRVREKWEKKNLCYRLQMLPELSGLVGAGGLLR